MRPRNLLIGAALLTLLIPLQAGAHRHVPREAVQTFADEWNKNHVDQILDLFEEDGEFHYPLASFFKGTGEIEALLREEFAGRMKNSRLELADHPHVDSLIFDGAIVEFHGSLHYADKTVPLLVSALLSWDGDEEEWSFISLRLVPREPRPE